MRAVRTQMTIPPVMADFAAMLRYMVRERHVTMYVSMGLFPG